MVTSDATPAPQQRWSPHLRGHLFLFDRMPSPSDTPSAGVRLLLAAAFVEVVRLAALTWLYPGVPLGLLLPALVALGLLVVPGIAGVKLSQLGFRPWRDWTATEKSYFLQVLLIANVVFPIVLAAPLRKHIAQAGMAWSLWNAFVPYLFYGFYQGVGYR